MKSRPLWERCIHHRGQDAIDFTQEYFKPSKRRVLLIGGAGFDPRSLSVPAQLSACCGDRLTGLFVREERPNATDALRKKADTNDSKLRELIPRVDIFPIEVFDIDNAPVGGRRATRALHERIDLNLITDVVLDCSAISVGVMFPFARYCYEATRRSDRTKNFHIVVLDDPATDNSIHSTACGKSAPLHTFNGGLALDCNNEAARLWLPQLGTRKREFLNLIFQDVKPHAVCPIIPFPSRNPRTGDALIQEYGDLFEGVSDPMAPTWNVDARDIVYTHEKSPLDLYRSVLRIDDARKRVFSQTGSQIILSPLGSKAVAIGLLMAALEREFAVVSVESIEYQFVNPDQNSHLPNAELVHLWLHGEAYGANEVMQDAET